MSLINDALKKAQKQRTGEAPLLAALPGVGGQSAARISRRARPDGFNPLLLRGALGAAVLLVLVVGGYFAFRGKSEAGPRKTESSPAQVAAAPSSVVSPPASASPPVTRPPSSEPASPAFTLPITPVPAPASQLPAPSLAKAPSPAAVPAAVISPPSAEASAPPRPEPKLEPRAVQYIENIKVAGIMARATDSKVLMNDRVYRIGDTIEYEMGIRLVGITANSLTFADGSGARYTRTF